MATQIKKTRTLLAPKFNDKGQITGSWGKQINTYQTEVQSKAWSAYGWPDWKGGSFYVENPMTNGQGQSLDQILAGNKRMINIPTPTDNTVSSNRYVTSPPSAVVAGGNNFVNQTVGAMSDWLPQATVATPKNPVVSRTTNKTDVGYSPTDYSDIDSYDLKGLNDYTRSLQYDQMNWVKLTKEQYLKMQRAIERAQELQSPAKTPNPLEWIIQQQQDTQAQVKSELEQQNQQDFQAQSDAENAWVQQELAYNQQQENTQKNTLGYILWAQWAGTSSYAVDKINEIGQNFARQNQTLRAESFARLQKYKAEQAGATRQELAKYDQNILQLQMKGAEFTVDNAQKLNEFNQEQAKTTEERLNNILQLAQAQMAEWTPLTDQEKAQAKQYGQLLIDAKWGINEALLKLIPPHQMSEALAQGALTRWAIPPDAPQTINSSNGAYYRDGKDYKLIEWTKPVEKAEKPDYWRYEFKDWKTYDKLTGQEVVQGVWWDARPFASQFPNQARAKNNNPAWITWNNTFAQTLSNAGIQFEKGTARPSNEWGNYFMFPNLTEWFKAYNLLWKSPSYQNLTVQQALSRWWTGSVPWVEQYLNQKVSSLDDNILQDIQQKQLKKESPSIFKFMESQPKTSISPEKQTAIQDVLTAITDLETSDGKEGAVWISIQKAIPWWLKPGETQFVPWTKAANFAAKFNSLRDLITLPNLDKLKGAMSDKDIAFLKSAATSLSLDMSEAEFDKTLKAVKDKYETMLWTKSNEVSAQPSNNNDPLWIR